MRIGQNVQQGGGGVDEGENQRPARGTRNTKDTGRRGVPFTEAGKARGVWQRASDIARPRKQKRVIENLVNSACQSGNELKKIDFKKSEGKQKASDD